MRGYYPKLEGAHLTAFYNRYDDYMAEHNVLCRYNRNKAEQERIRLLNIQQKTAKQNKLDAANYVRFHKQYFGICIISENLIINPLKSVKEFVEEGSAMHHCVGNKNVGYYRKKDSLVFSARDADGKRLATVEWDLVDKKILQCLAACNQTPPRQEEINNLVTQTMINFQTTKTV